MELAQNLKESQERNHRYHINQLPPELLSRIFILCDLSEAVEDIEDSCIQFIVPAVCHHWREIALCTTTLWTSIEIAEHVPWMRTMLYLTRSGSVAPLDIKISLPGVRHPRNDGTLTKWETYGSQAYQVFAFITQHGGLVNRWRSLSIYAETFIASVAMMDYLASVHLPSLESLSLVFGGPSPYHLHDQQLYTATLANQTARNPISPILAPRLLAIKAQGVPNTYLFGIFSQPRLTGLTDVYINFQGPCPSVDHMYSMLAASPNLTRFHILTNGTRGFDQLGTATTRSLHHPTVALPSLKNLGMMHIVSPTWNLSVLKTFKAPSLEILTFGFLEEHLDAGQSMVDYILNQSTTSSPCFSLTLSELSFYTFKYDQPDYEPLLRAHPNVTTLRVKGLAPLLKRPWLAPNLANLEVSAWDALELKDAIFGRCADGLPLKKVDVYWCAPGEALTMEDREQLGALVDLNIIVHDANTDIFGYSGKDSDDGTGSEGSE